ncbi:MAG: hypothetical protein ACOVOL_06365 [Bacteroidia bacterium]
MNSLSINSDQYILLLSFLGYWVVLAVFIFSSEKKVKVGLLNLLIHLAYSSFSMHGLVFKSHGGSALAWFLYLLFFLWIHTAINFTQIVYGWMKSRKKTKTV